MGLTLVVWPCMVHTKSLTTLQVQTGTAKRGLMQQSLSTERLPSPWESWLLFVWSYPHKCVTEVSFQLFPSTPFCPPIKKSNDTQSTPLYDCIVSLASTVSASYLKMFYPNISRACRSSSAIALPVTREDIQRITIGTARHPQQLTWQTNWLGYGSRATTYIKRILLPSGLEVSWLLTPPVALVHVLAWKSRKPCGDAGWACIKVSE